MLRGLFILFLVLQVGSLPTNYHLSMQNGEAFYRALLGSDCAMRVIEQMKRDCRLTDGLQEINNSVAIASASHLLDCAEKDLNHAAPLCGSSLECIALNSSNLLPWARLFANIESLCQYIDSANQSLTEIIETVLHSGGGAVVIAKLGAAKHYLLQNEVAKATFSQIFWLPSLDVHFHFYRIIPYILFIPTSIVFICCCLYKRPLLCIFGSTLSEATLAYLSGANGDYLLTIIIRYYWFFCAIHLNILLKRLVRYYATKVVNYIEERKATRSAAQPEPTLRRSQRGR